MAETFLHELLQMHNSVENKGERCAICLEGYGTLSRETGNMEVPIRLPGCHHCIGSACIAIWLKANNSCPICRQEFFPAQPRPYLEHGIMDGQDNDDDDYDDDDDEDGASRQVIMRDLNEDCCIQLELDREVAMISGLIIDKLVQSRDLSEGHTQWCLVACGIYMASHLTGEPKSPREIGAVTGVDVGHLRETYDAVFPDRERLADVGVLSFLENVFDRVAPLSWPATSYEVTDEQIENGRLWQMLREGCEEGCDALGLDGLVADFTKRIAGRLFGARLMDHISPREIVAVSVYMATLWIERPFGAKRVAEAVGTSEARIRFAYEVAFSFHDLLVGQPWLEIVGRTGFNSLLGRLPYPGSSP